jgi:hypothetical protein
MSFEPDNIDSQLTIEQILYKILKELENIRVMIAEATEIEV